MLTQNKNRIIDLGEAFLSSIDCEYIQSLKKDESFMEEVYSLKKFDLEFLSREILITMDNIYEGLVHPEEMERVEKKLIAIFLAITPISRAKKI